MDEGTFTGLGVSRPVSDALAERGITIPFAIQARVIPDGLAGRDVLAQSPTGSGKTLAFGVPLVERLTTDDALPAALVLVPTRELATQVAEELSAPAKARGLAVCAVYGGAPLPSQAKRAQKAAIIVATPGRLWDLIERRLLNVDNVRILVLDEADRMLDMGFQPQVDRIVRRIPGRRQTLFFSATLHGEVGRLARSYTTDPGRYEAEFSPARAASTSATRSSRSRARPSSTRSSSCSRPSRAWRWSSSARSGAPIGSRSGSARAARMPRPCTATSRSGRASACCASSRPARCERWSRPTSRRAGSTSRP